VKRRTVIGMFDLLTVRFNILRKSFGCNSVWST